MSQRKRKAKPAVHFDQNFLDTFTPRIIETVSGVEVTARYFTINEWVELKSRFKDWQGFNVGDLMLAHDFEAILEMCWLAIKDLNPMFETKDHLRLAMNTENFEEWARIWRPAVGQPLIEDEESQDPESVGNVPEETQTETNES